MRTYNLRKRILVTGDAGFLGFHLCERFLQDGHDVLCADNFFTGPVNLGNPEHVLYDVKSLLPKGAADGRLPA